MMTKSWVAKAGSSTCTSHGGKAVNLELTPRRRYGMVLAKEKNDSKAMEFLIRSVHKYPMNWGCWLEMTSLISRVEEVGLHLMPSLTFANLDT